MKNKETGGFLLPPGADVEQLTNALNEIDPGQYEANDAGLGFTGISKKGQYRMLCKTFPKIAALKALRYWAKRFKIIAQIVSSGNIISAILMAIKIFNYNLSHPDLAPMRLLFEQSTAYALLLWNLALALYGGWIIDKMEREDTQGGI